MSRADRPRHGKSDPTLVRRVTEIEDRFVEAFAAEFIMDLDTEAAAERARLPVHVGKMILASTRGQRAIGVAQRLRSSSTKIYSDEVLRRWTLMARADANDVVEVRRVNCRHCWGVDHEYQYTRIEQRARFRDHCATVAKIEQRNSCRRDGDVLEEAPLFQEMGGDDFHRSREPNRNCPECRGDGEAKVLIKDSRMLSAGARLLYDGVHVDVHGNVKVVLRSRDNADHMIAKHTGMFVNRKAIEVFDPAAMTPEQLDAVLFAIVERGDVTITSFADVVDVQPAE